MCFAEGMFGTVVVSARQANFSEHATRVPLDEGTCERQLLARTTDLRFGAFELAAHREDFAAMQTAQRGIAIARVAFAPARELIRPLPGTMMITEVQVSPDHRAEHDACHPRAHPPGERRCAGLVVHRQAQTHVSL